MKSKLKITLVLMMFSVLASAQVVTRNINESIVSGSVNFDASGGFLEDSGMLLARTDLTNFSFSGSDDQGFDGLVVYNTNSRLTPTSGAGVGGQNVEVGFYYFDNPTGSGFGNPTDQGEWIPIGKGEASKTDITATETVLDTKVAGQQLYAVEDTFTADGTTTAVTLATPSGITGLYRITIFKSGTNEVYASSLYSYDISNGNARTSTNYMSVVYPNGDYDYVMEYFK